MNDQPPRIALDTNQVWQNSVRAIASNRDALLAIAGVFVVLPLFAALLYYPFPQPTEGEEMQIFLQRLGTYTDKTMPIWLLVITTEAFGSLVMTTLLADPDHPTVGEAIIKVLRRFPTQIAGMLIIVAAGFFAMFLIAALGVLAGSVALTNVLVVPGLLAFAYVLARFALFGPIVQLEGLANPFAGLSRAAAMTRGSSWQVLIFLALLFIATRIVIWLAGAVVVLLVALAGNSEATMLADNLTSSLSQAILVVVMTGAVTQLYLTLRQR